MQGGVERQHFRSKVILMGNIATPRENHETHPLLEPLLQQHDNAADRQETMMTTFPLVSRPRGHNALHLTGALGLEYQDRVSLHSEHTMC